VCWTAQSPRAEKKELNDAMASTEKEDGWVANDHEKVLQGVALGLQCLIGLITRCVLIRLQIYLEYYQSVCSKLVIGSVEEWPSFGNLRYLHY
jgi:hypothetical protein